MTFLEQQERIKLLEDILKQGISDTGALHPWSCASQDNLVETMDGDIYESQPSNLPCNCWVGRAETALKPAPAPAVKTGLCRGCSHDDVKHVGTGMCVANCCPCMAYNP